MSKRKPTDTEKKIRSDIKLSHDFANQGDCPYCGDMALLIDAGQAEPCFKWQRIKDEEGEEE
jgi:hypothetical protein